MKISYNWISKYIDHKLSPEKLAEVLTRAGLEVEDIEPFSLAPKGVDGLVVGYVKAIAQHPNADKLKLTTVDVGGPELLKIVCGAPNVAQGQKVIVAQIGTKLFPTEGEPFVIKKSKIRGEDSEGMLCAEDEIGFGKSHEGLLLLREDAVIGQPFKEYLNSYTDEVFEVSLTPNRVDASSHIGCARDVAALTGQKVKYPEVPKLSGNESAPEIKITLEDTEACPRYSGIIVKNIIVKDSPDWLQNALRAIGLAPINNIVDVTNFVLHELGHPLHAFDLSKIKGNAIIVKNSTPGTEFITLDKQSRKLDGSELMICNAEEPMALAGVFGGLESGISNETKSIFIESAYFNPSRIRKTGRKHQLFTDASFRFERGTDPNVTITAMLRAAQLIAEVSGGEIVNCIYDEYPAKISPVKVDFKLEYLNKIAGHAIPIADVRNILESLGIIIVSEKESEVSIAALGMDIMRPISFELEIPTFKIDVKRPIDVVEEIMRIYSFDKIPLPSLVKSILQTDPLYSKEQLRKKLSIALAGLGFSEACHLSFTGANENREAETSVQVLNPISIGLEYIRDNMMKPGLKSVSHNINRQQLDVKLFEWGNTYHQDRDFSFNDDSKPEYWQKSYLSFWVTGNQHQESWYDKQKPADFYFLKGICEQVLNLAGVKIPDYKEGEDPAYEYSMVAGKIMTIGKLSPSTLKEADISKPVFYAEINTDVLLNKAKGKETHYSAISKFPRVDRDLSLSVPRELKYDAIKDLIKKSGSGLLQNIFIFDVYQGEQVRQGYKSYSIRLEFEDKTETLEDKKIDKIMKRILENLEKELDVRVRI